MGGFTMGLTCLQPIRSNPVHMEPQIVAAALELIRGHLAALNSGDLVLAREQLFQPVGTSREPGDTYVRVMRKLTPFVVEDLLATRYEPPRKKRHGDVATTWAHLTVNCALGRRTTLVTVWWFPDLASSQISVRPSAWVLEYLQQDEVEEGDIG